MRPVAFQHLFAKVLHHFFGHLFQCIVPHGGVVFDHGRGLFAKAVCRWSRGILLRILNSKMKITRLRRRCVKKTNNDHSTTAIMYIAIITRGAWCKGPRANGRYRRSSLRAKKCTHGREPRTYSYNNKTCIHACGIVRYEKIYTVQWRSAAGRDSSGNRRVGVKNA